MAVLVKAFVKDINRDSEISGSDRVLIKLLDVNSNRIDTIDFGPYAPMGLGLFAAALKDDIKNWTNINWGITWQALDVVRIFNGDPIDI